ncbi:trafficking kinesin-binding protein 2 isoform X2 [Gadus morhua]|uniref:trafficking kinesin-binding protein 2 isoform X2 n=1 Tax=Gadus morhua TaxID=8049 RepID=UPI0011B7FFDF|nr:trafficking kinesin-binding protein 2-like isoform X2 [Gadus morhua]
MFEVKPHRVEKKESSTETDEGLGSSGKRYGSGSLGSGSLYLSDSQDWALSPGCSPDEAPGQHSAVSPSLADETFRYMILSADRVEQMTRTYNDIEVVTHLLSERDRDLELAARIGQSLLQRNNLLQERNEAVEEQLNQAIDQVHQLQHELAKKDELLRMVASASEESESDSSCSTPHPLLQRAPGGGASTAAAAAAALGQLEALQGKLEELEEENQALRSEASHLKTETFCYEEKEQRLVNDCVKELRESSSQVLSLADELSQKGEEVLRHQEEIAQLLSQIVELQHRVKELALEKEELRIHLQASKEAQRQLTAELNELTERNAECLGMLHESQEEVKDLRSKSNTTGGLRRHLSYGLYPMDSLAAEIEGTMRKELSVDEETIFQDQRTSQRRVFQTVRSVNTLTARAASFSPIPGSGLSPLVMTAQPFLSAQGDDHRPAPAPRPPGPPAGDHLSDAIRRLSLRRHNFLCERKFFQAERQRKTEALGGAGLEEGEGGASGAGSPAGSGRSSCSNLSELSAASGVFKSFLPERLQIVKPMEGSLTLHHWQQLAQPHLATLLDPRPGVVTKGFRPLSHDRDPPADDPPAPSYRLDDPEEEDEEEGGRGRAHAGGAEKGSTERGKPVEKDEDEEEEEEEEEGGIVFEVRVSSTPEDRRERPRLPGSPLPSATDLRPPLFRPLAAVGAVSYASALRAELTPGSAPGPAPVSTPVSPCAVQPVAAGTTPPSDAAPSPVRPEGAAVASAGAAAVLSSAQHPGKCQSSTYSTYTVTTCRILHPNDITQVTSSSQPVWSVAPPDPPSSLRTGPSTPVTPCRLNLGGSSCFPPRRPLAPPPTGAGLAKLVLERGISASARPAPSLRRPAPLLPQGPAGGPPPPGAPPAGAAGDQRPALALDNFLASRPAELFLQDVYGLNLGRAPPHPDLPSPRPGPPPPPPDPVSVGLVERLCRLGFGRVLQGPADPPPPSTFVVAAGGGSLLAGLRRNQSLPVMMGAPPAPARPRPPAPPTSLALPPPPWGDPKGQQRRGRLSSFTQPPSSGAGKH